MAVTAAPVLSARTFSDVTVMPLEIDSDRKLSFGVSAWLRDGTPVDEVTLYRTHLASWSPPYRRAERRVEAPTIYGGVVFGHYGHFLIDTLARYWFVQEHPSPVAWHGLPRRLASWQSEVFGLLGVDPPEIVARPTEFAQLTIPTTGSQVWAPVAPEHADALGVYPFCPPNLAKRVWLSRSRLTQGVVLGERELERLLAADGWTILHPQEALVREQLECMADASLIAGFDGSAFHTLLLGRDVRAQVAIVPRDPERRLTGTFGEIAAAKGFSQHEIRVPLTVARGEGRLADRRLENPAGLAWTLQAL